MSEHKALTGVEIKDAEKGTVQAVFATLDVVDLDGDVTVKGAFEDGAPVRISAYGHSSWEGELPVGKGTIRESGSEAILDGQFFLNTTHGRDHFETVKELGDLMQWSYGFDIIERSDPPKNADPAWRQTLQKLKVHEVSPVLLGAGVNTRTLAVKDFKRAIPSHSTKTSDAEWDGPANEAAIPNDAGAAVLRQMFAWVDPDGDPDAKSSYKFIHHEWDDGPGAANMQACLTGISVLNGARGGTTIPEADMLGVHVHLARHMRDGDRTPPEMRSRERLAFPDEAEIVLGDVKALVARVEGWGRDSDSKEGRVLSAANRERLAALVEALGESGEALRALLAETDPNKDRDALATELARFVRQAVAL